MRHGSLNNIFSVRMLGMRHNRHGLRPVIAVAAIATGAAWLVYSVWRSPHRIDLATFGSYAVGVVLMAGGVIPRVWQILANQRIQAEQVPELDQLTDLLAVAVEDQWTRVADEEGLTEHEPIPVRWRKSPRPIAEPSSAAVHSRRFAPLPGLRAVTLERMESGWITDLHAVYGQCHLA